ncbi:MAG: universal stress protein [Haloarculaceae archaeon]
MSRHVLVAIDYSERSKAALRQAFEDFPDAEITALHVIDFRSSDLGPGGFGDANAWDDWFEDARDHADELLAEVEAIAAEYDREVVTATAVGEDAKTIIEYVGEHDVDHVYVGSHGRTGVMRVLLGSVAETVVRRAPVPVTVVR